MKNTKRGHYIPEVYSKNFCVPGSKPPAGYMYQKTSKNNSAVLVQPQNFGVKNYYYAFERKDGSRDTQSLEAFYNLTENTWPKLTNIFENQKIPSKKT